MKENDIREHVTRFIRDNFMYTANDDGLDPDAPLLEQGIIDSMGVVEIIEFLEDRFGVEVADQDITEENLGTVSAMSRYVAGRMAKVTA
jgi:acyl carrier protein